MTTGADRSGEAPNAILLLRIDELELCLRCANCLQNANIQFVGELVQLTEQDMLQMPRFGRKNLRDIKDILANMGLALGMKVDDWPQTLEAFERPRKT